jgi:hypothetical protein
MVPIGHATRATRGLVYIEARFDRSGVWRTPNYAQPGLQLTKRLIRYGTGPTARILTGETIAMF